jgi:hypothetical protein
MCELTFNPPVGRIGHITVLLDDGTTLFVSAGGTVVCYTATDKEGVSAYGDKQIHQAHIQIIGSINAMFEALKQSTTLKREPESYMRDLLLMIKELNEKSSRNST